MRTPLIPWDAPDDADHPDLVWRAKMDQRYIVEVRRTGGGSADLVIFDHNDSDKELKTWPVSLAYGARFGPDVDDVATWQNMCAEFVDSLPPTA